MNDERRFLRHALATLAYRAGKVLRDAPASMATACAGGGSRPAIEILAHLGDIMEWGASMAADERYVRSEGERSWDEELTRFFAGLARFDQALAADTELGSPAERLFQGPVADALTHVGQLALLRRLAGDAVPGENFHRAEIELGRVGLDQAPPVRPMG